MPRILLTRPRTASEKLAKTLRDLGYSVSIEPLLAIEALKTPPPSGFEDAQATMITSSNALDVLDSLDSNISILLDRPCFCVGLRTAESARNFGFRFVEAGDGDGRDLAQLLANSLSDKKRPILHIAGQEIDPKAKDELKKRGYDVLLWQKYKAQPLLALSENIKKEISSQQINAVLVFSVRTAEILCKVLTDGGLELYSHQLTAIGLSQDVAKALNSLSWRQLAIAEKPSENAMIDCLRRLHPVS